MSGTADIFCHITELGDSLCVKGKLGMGEASGWIVSKHGEWSIPCEGMS